MHSLLTTPEFYNLPGRSGREKKWPNQLKASPAVVIPGVAFLVRFPAAMKHFAAVAAEKLATVLGGAPWTAEGQRRSEDAQRVKFARSHMTS